MIHTTIRSYHDVAGMALTRILAPKPKSSIRCSAPTVPSVPHANKSDFKGYNTSLLSHDKFWSAQPTPIHIQHKLPSSPTDIKGVDEAAWLHIRKTKISKNIPRVLKSPFFSLRYFPQNHHVSRFRKSNVAYTFSNRGGYKLNDKTLEDSLASYKGKYKSHEYFVQNLQPLHTAFGRTSYRKFIKKSLFDSLHKYVKSDADLDKVSGVFKFNFNVVPGSEVERKRLRADMDKCVKTVLSPKFVAELEVATIEANKLKRDIDSLANKVKTVNTLAEWELPGYTPKLPFLHK